MAGLTVAAFQQRKASLYCQSKVTHQVTCRASPEGLPVIGSKTYLDMCEVSLYGVLKLWGQYFHSTLQLRKGMRGRATLAMLGMKTHGENNKLICCMNLFFSFSLKSLSDPHVMRGKGAHENTPVFQQGQTR